MTIDTFERKPTASPERPRVVPPRWLLAILAVLVAIIPITLLSELVGDHALSNVIAILSGLLTFQILLVWFLFFSSFARVVRLGIFVVLALGVGIFVALFRIDGVSGEMLPIFVLRSSVASDRGLAAMPDSGPELTPDAESMPDGDARVDLGTIRPDDFPQFLGPRRSASIDGVSIESDWSAHPPQLIWKREIGAGWSAFAVVNGWAVTMEQRGESELVSCYELATGEVAWAHPIAARYETVMGGVGPRSTPTIHDGRVYALGARGHLVCLAGATGRLIWSVDLLERFQLTVEEESEILPYGRANSPLIVDDLVVVPGGGPKGGRRVALLALDRESGEMRWEYDGGQQISCSSPTLATLAGRRQILIVNEATVSAHVPETGKLLWERDWPGESSAYINVSQAVPIAPDRVLLSKAYGQGAELLRVGPGGTGVESLWRNRRVLKTKFSNVAIRGDFVYALSDGILECVDLKTGRRVWKAGRYGHGQILRVGDTLIVLSEQGRLTLVSATPEPAHRVLASLEVLEGKTWNNLALSGSHLLIRNASQAVCYRLRLRKAGE